MSGYIGTQPVPQATQTREAFTATSGQTTFNTGGYTAGYIDVFLNGVKLVNGSDFTASNGSDVVLTSGAAAGDTVEVVAYSTFEVNSQTFTGTTTLTGDLQGTTATFSGAITPTGGVYLGGTGSANLLGDYETGTWTPQISAATPPTSITYSAQYGHYVRIGRSVTVTCNLAISSKSGGSGGAIVEGLPFASTNNICATGALETKQTSLNSGYTWGMISMFGGASFAFFRQMGSGQTEIDIPITSLNGTWQRFSLTYLTDA